MDPVCGPVAGLLRATLVQPRSAAESIGVVAAQPADGLHLHLHLHLHLRRHVQLRLSRCVLQAPGLMDTRPTHRFTARHQD